MTNVMILPNMIRIFIHEFLPGEQLISCQAAQMRIAHDAKRISTPTIQLNIPAISANHHFS